MTPEPPVTIITIKWGTRYPMSMVNRLAEAVRANGLPDAKFICFTDEAEGAADSIEIRPLPKIALPEEYQFTFWRKVSLFDPELALSGACLYFDLDVVITGDLSPLLHDWQSEPRFIKNWVGKKTARKPRYDRVNSSVVLFEGSSCGKVLQTFNNNREETLATYPGDQGFTYDCLADRATFFNPDLCVSFKKHCLPKFPLNLILPPRIPKNAAVVIFHGHPDPIEARQGYRGDNIRRWNRPSKWLTEKISP